MTPLKVAMLTQVYLPFIGGAEKQLAAVLQRLPAYGIEPMVITRRHDASPVDDRVEGVPVHRIEVGRHRELASITYTLKGILALRRFRPDVVHAFELRSPSTTAVAWRALSRTPVLAKVLRGGTLGDIAALSRKPSDRMRLQRILRKIDAFAVISREIDDELAAEGVSAERRLFIPNGVDLDSYLPATPTETTSLRDELGLGAGPVALFAGRLEREKQVDRLIEIWPRVRAAVPGATLVVVGTGSLEEGLKAGAPEGVRLVGKQTAMPHQTSLCCHRLPRGCRMRSWRRWRWACAVWRPKWVPRPTCWAMVLAVLFRWAIQMPCARRSAPRWRPRRTRLWRSASVHGSNAITALMPPRANWPRPTASSPAARPRRRARRSAAVPGRSGV